MARALAPARPRPLPRRARRRARPAPRPAVSRIPPAHARRSLHVVRPEGAPGGRLGRRGGAPRRHAHRRDRVQDRRRTAAARRRARQPDRPAEPRTVPRPARRGAVLRARRFHHPADRDGDRSRPLQAGQRLGRHRGRQLDPADLGAPSRPAVEAAGHAGAARRRPVRPADPLGARAAAHHRLRRHHPPHPAGADHLQRPRDPAHRLDRPRARRHPAAAQGRRAEGRRARDVSRQAHRRRPHRGVQAGDAHAQERPRLARDRHAPLARTRRDDAAVPAGGVAGGPVGRRLRGALALGPSQDGTARRRPTSSRSPRRPASSSSSGCSHWTARRASSPPGSARRGCAIRCSAASIFRRASCCATT